MPSWGEEGGEDGEGEEGLDVTTSANPTLICSCDASSLQTNLRRHPLPRVLPPHKVLPNRRPWLLPPRLPQLHVHHGKR